MGDSSTNDIAIYYSGNKPGGLQAEYSGVGRQRGCFLSR